MKDEFRATATHLLPEIWTVATAGLLALGILRSRIEIEIITMFPETPAGATLNMAVFVLPMAVVATLMYLLLRYGREKIFRAILKIAVVLTSFVLLVWYFSAVLSIFEIGEELGSYAIIIVPLALTALVSYAINRTQGIPQVASITFLGAMLGTFLGASVPTLTTIILLLGLAAYDIIAVFKGPIGKIAEKTELENLSGATFTFKDLTVGLGDLVFYSMLASHAAFSFGLVTYLVTSLGILVGTFFGFKMLERRSTFPGLPFSLVLGLGLMLITAFAEGRLDPSMLQIR